MAQLVRVRSPFSCVIPGNPGFVAQEGMVLNTDHPAYRGREALFEPVEAAAARTSAAVEQATAAPGERRSRVRSVKLKETD